MKKLDFPILTANDIEVRVQNVKAGVGFSLLLYKTARTDAKYLDQVCGAFGWQTKFYTLKNTIYCSIGIYNEETKEWVWKDDAGAETQVEQAKGEASDAFKRAGFKWGIGRTELYSSPFIWVKETGDNTSRATYNCTKFGVDANKVINTLEIVNDKTGEVVYSMENGKQRFIKNNDNQPLETKASADYIKLVKNYYLALPIDRQDKFLKNVIIAEFGLDTLDSMDIMVARKIYTKYIGGNR